MNADMSETCNTPENHHQTDYNSAGVQGNGEAILQPSINAANVIPNHTNFPHGSNFNSPNYSSAMNNKYEHSAQEQAIGVS